MTRLTSAALASGLITGVLCVGLGGVALAQSQQAIAEKDNDEGKKLMGDHKFDDAADKFRDAAQRTNEPKYFFNLCTAYYQGGRYPQAMTACNNVKNANPSPEQGDKADTLIAKIKAEADKQNISLVGGGGGGGDPTGPDGQDPNATDPNTGTGTTTDPNTGVTNTGTTTTGGTGPSSVTPAIGRPPSENVFEAKKPDNRYTWTLGVELFGGAGTIGSGDVYGTASGGIRAKGDYLLNSQHRVGAQGYVQYTSFTEGANSSSGTPLTIIDVGAALYKDICPPNTERLCLRPLVGASIALMNPGDMTDADGTSTYNYTAIGGRAELGLNLALGTRNEHVISVALGANGYTQVIGTPNGEPASDTNLEKGGLAGYLSIGYTYRFNTPLGHAALVTLE